MILIGLHSFSQDTIFHAQYAKAVEYNYEIDDYDIAGEDQINVSIEVWEESFVIIDPNGRGSRTNWEFDSKQSNEDVRVYYTEPDGEVKIVFSNDPIIIAIFFNYNLETNRYEKATILSDIAVE